MTEFLRVEGLTKRFGAAAAVDDLSLAIGQGEILALLGPSGSGKTTTLRLLAGFETPDAGRILVNGEDVTRARAVSRRFGMVFQHYALFPHLDVGENVAFGLESLRVTAAERGRRVTEALALVDLAGLERRRVTELSGGQQQRVALARALAPEPRVLLLDEPLSNLDPALREHTRREIRGVIHRVGITTVIVTHEQEEAFDLGDRLAVLRKGRIEQVGTPDELYRGPANAFVAAFVGRSSWLTGTVQGSSEDPLRVTVEGASWGFSRPAAGRWQPEADSQVQVMIRPEALRFTDPAPNQLRGTITDRRFAGATAFFTVITDAGATVEVSAPPGARQVADAVGLVPLCDPADREQTMRLFEVDRA
jgi:ABC-type Fe3+/spermidine/putrescine transport system ATPase subunit